MGAPTVAPRRVPHDTRYVVGDHETVEADFLEDLHDLEGVHLAAVDKGFVEVVDWADDIAEVDIDDFALAAEVTNSADNIVVAAHLRPTAHTKVEAMVVAVEGIHIALEIVEGAADPGDAAERGASRWVVWVQR